MLNGKGNMVWMKMEIRHPSNIQCIMKMIAIQVQEAQVVWKWWI